METRSTPSAHHEERHDVDAPLRTRRLFGFDFIDEDDLDRVADHVVGSHGHNGSVPLLVTPNVDYVVRLQGAPAKQLRDTAANARFILPDGQPIVWTSRLSRTPLRARLPGSELFPKFWQRVVDGDISVVVITSCAAVAEQLEREHARAATVVAPWFAADDHNALDLLAGRCADAIAVTNASFVVIGIGWPKQQLLASRVLASFPPESSPPLFLLLGAALDMYCGRVERAPAWMQRHGLEWLHRFRLEPRRLFRRYFVTDMRFIPLAAREVARQRRLARAS
ncbi:MAG TPA: WecB/TagA/CpsF family glycosyltransferase [Ilumatobacteraceae bacterium]